MNHVPPPANTRHPSAGLSLLDIRCLLVISPEIVIGLLPDGAASFYERWCDAGRRERCFWMIPAKARNASFASPELGNAAATSGSRTTTALPGVPRCVLVGRGTAEVIFRKDLVGVNLIDYLGFIE